MDLNAAREVIAENKELKAENGQLRMQLERLRLAFIVNALRQFPEKSRDDISDEADRIISGAAATAAQPACWIDQAELRNIAMEGCTPSVSAQPVSEHDVPLYTRAAATGALFPIRTDDDHARAVERMGHLMEADPAPDTAEGAELEALSLLVGAYERKRWPWPPVA